MPASAVNRITAVRTSLWQFWAQRKNIYSGPTYAECGTYNAGRATP